MAQYTIEDIEIVRQKSGISYEEAVNLLEYHNGSLARALVDLEKNGRLKDAKAKHASHSKGKSIFNRLYRVRVKVTKGDVGIVNLSLLFILIALCTAFWIVGGGLIAAFVLGYRVSIDRNSKDFAEDSFDNIVRNASSNVKKTVYTFARDFESVVDSNKSAPADAPQEEELRTETAASGTIPVNVQFPDGGSVEVTEDADGFHEADVQ